MLSRYENRAQLALALLIGLLLLVNLLAFGLVALAPRAPVLLAVLVVTLSISVPFILLFPRWLLRPFHRLFDEAARVPIETRRTEARDETEFVLETFQAVVAQLRAQAKELERLNAQVRARAESAEELNARIIASMPSGLVAFDAQGRATVINAPARALLQTDRVGAGLKEVLKAAPELIGLVEDCLRHGALYRREEVAVHDGVGQARKLGVTVAPIAAHGTPGGALCLMTDITEVLELREAVARKRNLESLGEMSAGLAHEFKNALATLQGYAQLLQRVGTGGIESTAAAALLDEVRDLSAMVTAFLDFARPRPLEPTEVDLRELIEECCAELARLYAERRVELTIAGEFARARADVVLLRQALLNILRNAAEAIPEESAERKVAVRGSGERDQHGAPWSLIEIEDTGPGIRAQDLEKIFIPFFTTKKDGHGIGLALAHRIITDHGGTLTAANSTRHGAIFTVKLPALIRSSESDGEEQMNKTPTQSSETDREERDE